MCVCVFVCIVLCIFYVVYLNIYIYEEELNQNNQIYVLQIVLLVKKV